ncbi:MAG: RDD family protein [Gammaproteobacteria bacterium]
MVQGWGRLSCCHRFGWGEQAGLPPPPGGFDPPNDRTRAVPRHAADLALAVQGRSAGIVSRGVAFWTDELFLIFSYAIAIALLRAVTDVFYSERQVSETELRYRTIISTVVYFTYTLLYDTLCVALLGRTLGKMVMGLMIVEHRGNPVRLYQAFWRACLVSFTIVLVCLAWFGVIRKDRRQLHDLLAHTTVIYAWDARHLKRQQDHLTDAEKLGPEFISCEFDA